MGKTLELVDSTSEYALNRSCYKLQIGTPLMRLKQSNYKTVGWKFYINDKQQVRSLGNNLLVALELREPNDKAGFYAKLTTLGFSRV